MRKPESYSDYRNSIRRLLETSPVNTGQFDPNGKCNAKCWYCPVRYLGNPKEQSVSMPIEDFTKVIANIKGASGVTQHLRHLHTAHYNEILLYKHFDEMADVFRKYGLSTTLHSNGTTFTPVKTDIVVANTDVFQSIILNIPAFNREEWAYKSGMSASLHSLLLRNIDYLHSKKHHNVSLQVNCATDMQGMLSKGILTSIQSAQEIVDNFKDRYPNFSVQIAGLDDRAGKLEKLDVISRNTKSTKRMVNCAHSYSRMYGWIHVNALGDTYICCNDFEMKYSFGNLLTQSFEDVWFSEKHIDTIMYAQLEGICTTCRSRIEE